MGQIMSQNIPEEILEAESSLEWALENLEFLGAGDTAHVFKHPDDDAKVIRISDYPDGWFLYAEQAMEAFGDDAGSYSAFYPVVYEIINKERELIGVSERLEEIENDSDLAEIVELINKAMITHDEDSWENLDQRLPDFRKFSQQLFHKIDLRDGNIMRRGGQIVINDPLRAIPYGMEESFRARHSLSKGSLFNP
jgi:hypothetical protein